MKGERFVALNADVYAELVDGAIELMDWLDEREEEVCEAFGKAVREMLEKGPPPTGLPPSEGPHAKAQRDYQLTIVPMIVPPLIELSEWCAPEAADALDRLVRKMLPWLPGAVPSVMDLGYSAAKLVAAQVGPSPLPAGWAAQRHSEMRMFAAMAARPEFPEEREVLERLIGDELASVRGPARGRLSSAREVAWWEGYWQAEPLAGQTEDEPAVRELAEKMDSAGREELGERIAALPIELVFEPLALLMRDGTWFAPKHGELGARATLAAPDPVGFLVELAAHWTQRRTYIRRALEPTLRALAEGDGRPVLLGLVGWLVEQIDVDDAGLTRSSIADCLGAVWPEDLSPEPVWRWLGRAELSPRAASALGRFDAFVKKTAAELLPHDLLRARLAELDEEDKAREVLTRWLERTS